MIAPPAFKGRGGHNLPDLIVVKSKAMGVGIHDDLSFGGGSCAEVCDTVALIERRARGRRRAILSEYEPIFSTLTGKSKGKRKMKGVK